ncbi:MAG: hypothetical protein WAO98_06425 [Alphaproteobacteria bacterium]
MNIAKAFQTFALSITQKIAQCFSPLRTEPGYDSLEERLASLVILRFGREGTGTGKGYPGGPLSDSAIVRIIRDDPENPEIMAWLHPHNYDPAEIRVTPKQISWRHCSNPTKPTEEDKKSQWYDLEHEGVFSSRQVALGMGQIILTVFAKRFPALATTPKPKTQIPADVLERQIAQTKPYPAWERRFNPTVLAA